MMMMTMQRLLLLAVMILLSMVVDAKQNGLRVDPDTTCTEAYQKEATKDVCLSTKDYYGRPCEMCSDKTGDSFCFNADQARWAKFLGATCEIGPEDARAA
jgi:cytochrome c5